MNNPGKSTTRRDRQPRWIASAAFCSVLAACLQPVVLASSKTGDTTATVTNSDGSAYSGVITELTDDLIVLDQGTKRRFPTDQVIRLTFVGRTVDHVEGRPMIRFDNGDRIAAQSVRIEDDRLIAVWHALPSQSRLTIPLETVRRIDFKTSDSKSAGTRSTHRSIPTDLEDDLLLLRNGDQITGVFQGFVENRFSMVVAGRTITVSRDGVAALAFNPKLISFPKVTGRRALLTACDKSRFTVRHIHWQPEGGIACEMVCGIKLKVPLQEIAGLQFLGGQLVYLSDLTPIAFQHTPFLSGPWDLETDRNVLGGPLRLRGVEYAKGLGMHSRSTVTYDLAGAFRRFQATVGLDDDSGPRASVVFTVERNGTRVWTSSLLTRKDVALTTPLIDVVGAKTLRLAVDYGDYGDIQDRADWCDAWLLK